MNSNPIKFMKAALEEAQKAYQLAEIPIGCVIVCQDKIIANSYNSCEQDKSPLHHAEIKAIQFAAKVKQNWRLNDCDLYVTLEPCLMCLGAIFQARIQNLFIGCFDSKRRDQHQSFVTSLKDMNHLTDNNHILNIHGGILEEECSQILKTFFKNKRIK